MDDRPTLTKKITYFGRPVWVACDVRCDKAWGRHTRPTTESELDPTEPAFLADDELGEAPDDPGTYEGGEGKPTSYGDSPFAHLMNKWCVRECERCTMLEEFEQVVAKSFSERRLMYDD
jgi:hypothetical protein